MRVRDGMTAVVLTVGPAHTLREAASLMAERRVGAAIVAGQDDSPGIGLLTERDVLRAVGLGQDVDAEAVSEHMSTDVVFAAPEWSLEEAACAMTRGGFRHLVVVEDGDAVGVLSVRDVVRLWTDEGALCEVPSSPQHGRALARA
jgi:CBS domain-containing protein